MPLYSYECPDCGAFEDWRALRDAELDKDCPACGKASPRQISMPFLGVLSDNARLAHQTNERSMERPRVVGRNELHKFGQARPHSHVPSPYASVLGHAH